MGELMKIVRTYTPAENHRWMKRYEKAQEKLWLKLVAAQKRDPNSAESMKLFREYYGR